MGIYWWRGRATWKQLQVVKTNFNGFVSYIFVGKSALSSRSVWCVCLWRKRMFSKTQSCGHANRIVPFEFVQRCQPLSGEHYRKWSWSCCDWNILIWIKKLAELRVSNMLPVYEHSDAKELVCMVIERWKTVISICIFSTLFSIYLPLVDEGNLFNSLYLFLLMVISFVVTTHPGLVNRLTSALSSFWFHFCCVPVFPNVRLQRWGKWFHDLIVRTCVLQFFEKKACLKLSSEPSI